MDEYRQNVSNLRERLEVVLNDLKIMADDPGYRARPLSMAVTNVEQGLLWLREYARDYDLAVDGA